MEKYYSAIVLISMVLLMTSCSEDENSPVDTTEPARAGWTFLLYDDADFSNAYDPLNNFSNLVSSNSHINYLVLQDVNIGPAAYYRIDEDHVPVVLQTLPEVNMGSKTTLENFLNFAEENYPAERYIVAFYDHGGGWMGTCWDVTSNNDNLTPAEIGDALESFGGVDLVLFTAPCLMGSVESAYQLRNCCNYYIGSEDLSGFIFWRMMLDKFDEHIKNNISTTSRELAEEIISLHDTYKNATTYGEEMTMSAIDCSKLTAAVSSFDGITEYYLDHTDKFRLLTSGSIMIYNTHYYDLIGLLQNLKENESDEQLKNQISETILLFNDCVVAECCGYLRLGSNGLNIFFPNGSGFTEVYSPRYATGLDFVTDCHWDELVFSFMDTAGPTAQNNILEELLALNSYVSE